MSNTEEPTFLLRAQDPAAPVALECWAIEAERRGTPKELIDEAFRHARAMRDWRAATAEHSA